VDLFELAGDGPRRAGLLAEQAADASLGVDGKADEGLADEGRAALVEDVGPVAARASRRGMSSAPPSPAVILARIRAISRVPSRQGEHLPHDSSSAKRRKYRAMSTMQVSSSMTIMPPEPMIAPSSVSDS
jgi:hypothetical protein